VQYGVLVEAARAQIAQQYRRPLLARLARWLVFDQLLPHPARIRTAGRILRFYQRSGLQRLVRATRAASLVGMRQAEQLLPAVSQRFFFEHLGKTFPAVGHRRFRVAFFAGCVAQIMFNELNEATVRVLQRNGCEVVVPAGQVCCGALAVHAGEREGARQLAQKNMEVFPGDSFDAIVTNAAGCGSTLKEYEMLFPPGSEQHERGRIFSRKVKDVTEFLAAAGLTQALRETRLRVTYQDSCHLAHGQKIKDAPRKLLHMVPGVELVEMFNSDHCCGSAGVYNVQHPEMAMALLDEKMVLAKATGANVVATANPGCMLQLRAGMARSGSGQRVMHVVELLDEASG
jgi:glycolate oxidase iron-sulfur subunit